MKSTHVRRLRQREQHQLVGGEAVHFAAGQRCNALLPVVEFDQGRLELALRELIADGPPVGRTRDHADFPARHVVEAEEFRCRTLTNTPVLSA